MQFNVAFKVLLRPTQQKEVDKYCRKWTYISTLFTIINQMPAKYDTYHSASLLRNNWAR
jgi:hypothetical protein